MNYLKPHILSDAQEAELLALYPNTDTGILAKRYGVSKNLVIQIANKSNVHKEVNNKRRANYVVPPCVVGGTGTARKGSKYDVDIAAIEAQMLIISTFSTAFDDLVIKRNNLLARSFSFAK